MTNEKANKGFVSALTWGSLGIIMGVVGTYLPYNRLLTNQKKEYSAKLENQKAKYEQFVQNNENSYKLDLENKLAEKETQNKNNISQLLTGMSNGYDNEIEYNVECSLEKGNIVIKTETLNTKEMSFNGKHYVDRYALSNKLNEIIPEWENYKDSFEQGARDLVIDLRKCGKKAYVGNWNKDHQNFDGEGEGINLNDDQIKALYNFIDGSNK